ncbi:MAG TPA: acetoin utilization protein AcuC [Candidatus Nanopelagicales bacterium]|nr:acetoin utilization protein AcuC [Candidatus Nanopelagicales bacterium]
MTSTDHSTSLVWDEELAEYDFGPGHPLAPIRVQLAMRLIGAFGLERDLSMIGPIEPAADELIERVHSRDYIEAVKTAGGDPPVADPIRGLGTSDDPLFADMHRASARVCAATLAAAQAVWRKDSAHGINLAGGLHHAMRDRAAGFCIYNDLAVAIAWLLDAGAKKVAYVDLDVHHGDGVESIFWDDPRVMTISIHESPETLFPGTGRASDIGGPQAQGSAVNIALPAGTGDQGWLRALHGVVPELLEAFAPDVIVSQNGVDSHADDPLAHLALSVDGQRMGFESVHRWAHAFAGGRLVAAGGGGYEWVDVVPRAWTHLVAEISGRAIEPHTEVPEEYQAFVQRAMGRIGPARMTDGQTPWPRPLVQGWDPHDPVDAAILSTRESVFGFHGLDPDPEGW